MAPAKTRKGGRAPGAPVWALSFKKVEVYFQLKRLINKHKNEILDQNFALLTVLRGQFWPF